MRSFLARALAAEAVSFSGHPVEEMQNDGITIDEALSILRSGVVEPGELERGSWRYRVRARRLVVVVTLAEDRAVVVTAWRVTR